VSSATWLWCHKPNDATISQRSQGVYQRIYEIAILIPPPEEYCINNVIVGFVNQFRDRCDCIRNRLIAINIESELLDYESFA
jgi:hypothetical protein